MEEMWDKIQSPCSVQKCLFEASMRLQQSKGKNQVDIFQILVFLVQKASFALKRRKL